MKKKENNNEITVDEYLQHRQEATQQKFLFVVVVVLFKQSVQTRVSHTVAHDRCPFRLLRPDTKKPQGGFPSRYISISLIEILGAVLISLFSFEYSKNTVHSRVLHVEDSN